MIWNEKLKRNIPKGWKLGNMKDFLTIGNGKDHKFLSDGRFPVYGSGGLMRYVDRYIHKGESLLLPRKGSLNNYMYVNEAFWTVDTMFYTEEKFKGAANYIFYSLQYIDINRYNSGTGVPSMTSTAYYSIPFVIPTNKILGNFYKILEPWLRTIQRNNKEIENLTIQRDELLPLLMNGQISFKTKGHLNCD